MSDGTFMVYRILEQHVARFEQGIEQAAAATGLSREVVKARMVGRWENGIPLALAPTEKDRDLYAATNDKSKWNDFGFKDDFEGRKCPMGAHIRRANPRDSLAFNGNTVDRHRIVRRGMPYGPSYSDEPDADRGLIFIALNASIAGQFELIQRDWLNSGHTFGLGAATDPLMGVRLEEHSGAFVMPGPRGTPPTVCLGLEQFVTLKGGEYLFVPGREALKAIAGW